MSHCPRQERVPGATHGLETWSPAGRFSRFRFCRWGLRDNVFACNFTAGSFSVNQSLRPVGHLRGSKPTNQASSQTLGRRPHTKHTLISGYKCVAGYGPQHRAGFRHWRHCTEILRPSATFVISSEAFEPPPRPRAESEAPLPTSRLNETL